MKKIFSVAAAIILAISFQSCSDDDDKGASASKSVMKLKLNGVETIFDNVVVESDNATGDFHSLTVSGQHGDDDNDRIVFYIFTGNTGDDAFDYVEYFKNGESFQWRSDFESNVTVNENGKLKGTFSCTFSGSDPVIAVTEGSFDIRY